MATDETLRPKPVDESCELLANDRLYGTLWDMELRAPRIARTIEPGQFIHMKVPGMDGRILRRPFSVYAADADAGVLRILYQVVGKGSAHMTTLAPGRVDAFSLLGPMGNPWSVPEGAKRVLFVLGGVGAAPLAMFGQQLVQAGVALDVCMGAQTQGALVLKDHYERVVGVKPLCATDDGSFGHAGFVTQPAADMLAQNAYDLVCSCGPEPLMRIVADLAAQAGVPCQVSLEKRMACGIGACLSCVVDTVDGRKRSCVDGPVFDAGKVVW
jgi:dihydroorotate dehydrogenase electron transfer subunit